MNDNELDPKAFEDEGRLLPHQKETIRELKTSRHRAVTIGYGSPRRTGMTFAGLMGAALASFTGRGLTPDEAARTVLGDGFFGKSIRPVTGRRPSGGNKKTKSTIRRKIRNKMQRRSRRINRIVASR